MGVRHFDHVGIVVDDLDAVTAFFLDLGFELEGARSIEGEWVDRVVGLDGVQVDMVMVGAPDGSGKLELSKFHAPSDQQGASPAPANRPGIRHLAFVVEDLDAILDRLRDKGLQTVGEVADYKDIYRLCYLRGPEGLIIELAEEVGRS